MFRLLVRAAPHARGYARSAVSLRIEVPPGFVTAAEAVKNRKSNFRLFTFDAVEIRGIDTALQFTPDAKVGIAEAQHIRYDFDTVLLGDANMYTASQAFIWLRSVGFKSVFIVNGGLPAWASAGGPLNLAGVGGPPAPPTPPATDDGRKLSFAAFQDVVGRSPDVQLLDVRTAAEYTGEKVLGGNPRPGHIPGALLLDQANLRGPGGLTSVDIVKEQAAKLNLNPDAPVITYCQAGFRAAFAAVALYSAGFSNVSVYIGSFADYSRSKAPVEK